MPHARVCLFVSCMSGRVDLGGRAGDTHTHTHTQTELKSPARTVFRKWREKVARFSSRFKLSCDPCALSPSSEPSQQQTSSPARTSPSSRPDLMFSQFIRDSQHHLSARVCVLCACACACALARARFQYSRLRLSAHTGPGRPQSERGRMHVYLRECQHDVAESRGRRLRRRGGLRALKEPNLILALVPACRVLFRV